MTKEDRPDVQIFMALLDSNLWRPSDSGRRITLDWLHFVARNSFAQSRTSGVKERRESFRAALALEDTDSPRHPSQVRLTNLTLRFYKLRRSLRCLDCSIRLPPACLDDCENFVLWAAW